MRPGTRYLALSVSQITESDSLKDIAEFCYENTDFSQLLSKFETQTANFAFFVQKSIVYDKSKS